MAFKNRKVVVTGGTGVMGTAVVTALVAAAAEVFIPAFRDDEVARFALKDHPRVHVTPGVNLTREADVEAFYGGLNGLWASLHITGGFAMSALAETSAADFHRQMDMNALTAFLCCREAVKVMRRGTGGGRIVNVAARPGVEPRTAAGMAAYGASKAAVAALTQALGAELAAEGIWVNAVVPSILDTPDNRAAMPDADPSSWPKADEVAHSILFLASPENRVTSGALVPVYGKA